MASRLVQLLQMVDSFESFNLLRTGIAFGAVAVVTDVTMTIVKRYLHKRALRLGIYTPKTGLLGTYACQISDRLVDRPEAMAVLDQASSLQRNSCSLIITKRGSGITTLLKNLAATRNGAVYTSLAGVSSVASLTTVFANSLGLTYSIQLPAWLVAVQRVVLGEAHTVSPLESMADSDGAWSYVTSHFEAAAAGNACGRRPLLIFDHANELSAEAAGALNAWILSLLSVGLANVLIVCDRPYTLFATSVVPRSSVLSIPPPTFASLKAYMQRRCPSLSNGAANYILSELTGDSISMVEVATELLVDHGPDLELVHRVLLQRMSIVSRPWHTVAVDPLGDPELDEKRFLIFTLCVELLLMCPPRVEPTEDGKYEVSDSEAISRFMNRPKLNFQRVFELGKYRVYRQLVETPGSTVTLPIWTTFDEVSFQWPGMRQVLEWVLGPVSTPRFEDNRERIRALCQDTA